MKKITANTPFQLLLRSSLRQNKIFDTTNYSFFCLKLSLVLGFLDNTLPWLFSCVLPFEEWLLSLTACLFFFPFNASVL